MPAPQLANYFLPELVVPPRMDVPPVRSWPSYGNDEDQWLEDCTCAAVGHQIQAWDARAGRRTPPPSEAEIELLYWQTGNPPATSGDAHSATNHGRGEPEVLQYWLERGVAGKKIKGGVRVDPQNLDHVRAALYLLGGVSVVLLLPKAAQRRGDFEVVADDAEGHAEKVDPDPRVGGGDKDYHTVLYVGYEPDSFTCVSWGAVVRATKTFHERYARFAYAVVPLDLTGLPAAGVDHDRLDADLAAIGKPLD
jgi:hypothetical protein